MHIKIDKQFIDVYDTRCRDRECLQVGMDHGPYVQGRGYTAGSSYRSRLVCLTRHLHGCPTRSVCPRCRVCSPDPPGAQCTWHGCSGVTVPQ
jgi:hypothetical protein